MRGSTARESFASPPAPIRWRVLYMGGFEPILIVLIWLGLQYFVLPRLGVPT